MGLLNFAPRFKQSMKSRLFNMRLRAKWWRDRMSLPLTAAHWELYDIIHRLYWRYFNDFPNLTACRDFNDRMQWLKLFDQSDEIIRCSDKLLVRDYMRERVGERYLVRVYQVHDHFSEIDFETLPNSFVLKVNHDSGSVILVRDKAKFDRGSAAAKVEASLRKPFGWDNGEWAYSYIEPKVFVEEFIESDMEGQPPDYKFYCVEGSVKFCHYIYDRSTDPKEQVISREGDDLATSLYPSFKLGQGFAKPDAWEEMISVAEELGKGFKYVRVDLYCTREGVKAGEMTFWPMAGLYKGKGQKVLGRLLEFDRTTFKPYLIPELEKTRSRFKIYPSEG